MNAKPTLIQAILLAALATAAPGGYDQEAVSATDTAAEIQTTSLRAETNHNRLVLSARGLAWERVQEFGLIDDRSKALTADVRAGVANNEIRLEPTADGFILDFGPSGGMGGGGDGVVSLTLSSGQVAAAPLRVEREAFSEFCLVPELGDRGADSALMRYAMQQEEAILRAARSPNSPVLAFALEGDHLVMTVTGASWNDVRAIAWRRVEGKDRTSALREALASGTARLTPTADGFVLEIDDTDLPETGEPMAALVLDTDAVVAALILPAPRR